MLYIISFQSISCPPGLRGGLQLGLRRGPSPRPHAAPPEGSSVRLKGRGFGRAAGHFDRAPQYKVLYRPATQSSDRASPRSFPQSSTPVFHTCSARSSGRFSRGILWAIPRNNSLWVRIPVLRPVFPSVIPSIFHPVSHTLLSSALWPVPQNNSQAGPRGGPRHSHPAHKYLRGIPAWQSRHLSSLRHGHPAHRYSSAIPTCRDVPKPVSERCSERFLTRSSDRLPVRARLSGGRGEKEVGKCLEFRNLGLLQGALDGEGTVQNIDRFH